MTRVYLDYNATAPVRAEASQRGLKAPVAQMDLGALALHGRFALILAAYSVLTYLRTPAALAAPSSTAKNPMACSNGVCA